MRTKPTISIVTPSYNQNAFIEKTIVSVLSQGYPNLEYIVIDGGSTDGSVETIRKYEDRLAYWVSEKDNGQYDAINKGFARATGRIMAWINSDDIYLPWTLDVVSDIFRQFPDIGWITSLYPIGLDSDGRPVECRERKGFTRRAFIRGENVDLGRYRLMRGYIQQESTFWRRELWEAAGGRVDASLAYAGDLELWTRFFRHAELHCVEVPLAGFRSHSGQKTRLAMDRYSDEARAVLGKVGNPFLSTITLTAQFVLSKIPRVLKRMLTRIGLFGGRPVLRYSHESRRWVRDVYV